MSAPHTLFLQSSGAVLQAGVTSALSWSAIPVLVPGLPPIQGIEACGLGNYALDFTGNVYAWASNIGASTVGNTAIPTLVPGLSGIVAVAGGGSFALALNAAGTVFAWGQNNYGALGAGVPGFSSNLPVPVIGLPPVSAIAASWASCMALSTAGAVYAWGHNNVGQVIPGYPTGSTPVIGPVQVQGLSNIVGIAMGDSHALALRADGHVFSWGYGSDSRLGTGPFSPWSQGVEQVVCLPVPELRLGMLPINGGSTLGFWVVCGGPAAASQWCFNAFSAEPLNATNPGAGSWFGLHIDPLILNAQMQLGVATIGSLGLFLAQLGTTGDYVSQIGNLPWAQLAGVTVYANSVAFNATTGAVLGVAPVRARTF